MFNTSNIKKHYADKYVSLTYRTSASHVRTYLVKCWHRAITLQRYESQCLSLVTTVYLQYEYKSR